MPFTGDAVVQQISDNKVRITGLSLDADAEGTIGLHGDATADVQLPAGFHPRPYQAFGDLVVLDASLEVSIHRAAAAGAGVGDIELYKGIGPTTFLIHLENTNGDFATSEAEIYVTFHE